MLLRWIDTSGIDMGPQGHIERGMTFEAPERPAQGYIASGRAVAVNPVPEAPYQPMTPEVAFGKAPGAKRVR